MNNKRHFNTILVTGGAGFIGSHVVRRLLTAHPDSRIVNVDLLTYAGNLSNLDDIPALAGENRYRFVHADIADGDMMRRVIAEEKADAIVNLAAETHVDRSIVDPGSFARTNVLGTMSLLNAARAVWEASPEGYEGKMYYQISTDEVFGALGEGDAPFCETTPYNPHSPYSAAKSSADHFVRAYHDTYGLPVLISNCSNNYGPNQFPEKLMPLVINNIKHGRDIPVYGRGLNIRDWLYVTDHAEAIDTILHNAAAGSTYCVGGNNEQRNIDIVKALIAVTDRQLGRPAGSSDRLITFVTDRKGHDLRYAIDSSRLQNDLGWKPATTFAEGLEKTVAWYLDNTRWLDDITSGEYARYYERMYGSR
ncbi:MAG: dTDP-glucose 4,6-dehydratase [Paramuribaculum sp.]|nr:dTDP-glucose 4,6-dehydratase [Paramuribaculum sp.]